MTIREVVQFEYDPERLNRQAHERGFESIQEYLEALIEDDTDVMDDFRQAFQEIKKGVA